MLSGHLESKSLILFYISDSFIENILCELYKCLFFNSIDVCPIGEYSSSGLVPCKPCPVMFYSNKTQSQHCIECPRGLVTTSNGSTSLSQCVGKITFTAKFMIRFYFMSVNMKNM